MNNKINERAILGEIGREGVEDIRQYVMKQGDEDKDI